MTLEKTVIQPPNQNAIWRNWSFIGMLTGSLISSLALGFYTIALPLIIYDLTNSTLAMSSMRAVEILPNLVLGMLIGWMVDKFNRKTFIKVVIVVQVLIVCMIISLLYYSNLAVWHLYILGFFFYTSLYSFSNAYHSSIPLIVEKDQLVAANSIRTFSSTILNIITPAVAGIVIFSIGYIGSLSITILGYIFLLLILTFIKIPQKYNYRKSNGIIKDIKNGWDQLKETKILWRLTLIVLTINIASASAGGVIVFFSVDSLGLTGKQLGIVISSQAIGGVVASLFAKKFSNTFSLSKLLVIVVALSAIGQTSLFLSANLIGLCVSIFIIGFGATILNINFISIRQSVTPPEYLGRVTGTINTLLMLATPFSFFIAGLVGEFVEVRYVFIAAAVLLSVILSYLIVFKPLKGGGINV